MALNRGIVCVTIMVGMALTASAFGQDSNYDLVQSFMEKSQYVHDVFMRLLLVHMYSDSAPIPEPMTFDNFTFHPDVNYRIGESHIYNSFKVNSNSRLFGFSKSRLTIQANNETYEINIHLTIPVATLTGSYDMEVWQFRAHEGYRNFSGAGVYTHRFNLVDFWVNGTAEDTEDGVRAVFSDVHSSLSFSSCRLWAENYSENNIIWDDVMWTEQSALYKAKYDQLEHHTAILLSESIKSYFGITWGFLGYTKEDIIPSLLRPNS